MNADQHIDMAETLLASIYEEELASDHAITRALVAQAHVALAT